MAKGGGFEREISKQISLWWSEGKTDNIFWRTPNSGGQATVRKKKGIYSYHGHGDISYRHVSGKKLMDMFAIETKRGYNKQEFKRGKNSPSSFQTLVDAPKHQKPGTFEKWLFQAERAAVNSRSQAWLLIHKPDGKRCMVFMSIGIAQSLFTTAIVGRGMEDICCCYVHVRMRFNAKIPQLRTSHIFGMRLESFLKVVKPKHIKLLLKRMKRDKERKSGRS